MQKVPETAQEKLDVLYTQGVKPLTDKINGICGCCGINSNQTRGGKYIYVTSGVDENIPAPVKPEVLLIPDAGRWLQFEWEDR